MGVRDLAKKLGMHHSVVHRIVSTFEQHGFLIQNRDTQKYHLGLKLLEYGKVVTDQLNIQQYFQPILKEIANSTGESVYLNMLEGKEGVCVSIVLSSKDIQYLIPVGDRSPLYAGASQKVMMAYVSEDLQEEIIQEGLTAVTSRTITDSLRLRPNWRKSRRRAGAFLSVNIRKMSSVSPFRCWTVIAAFLAPLRLPDQDTG